MKVFEKKQIPNILSFIRLIMVPFFAYTFFKEFPNNRLISLIIFIVAEITDVIDGYLARKNNWVSDFGKIIDPLADKLMQITAFICIALKTRIVIFLACLIIVKDLLMLLGGYALAKKGAKKLIISRWYGKLNSFILAINVGVLILFYENTVLTITLTIISACMMIFTLIMYLTQVYLKYLNKNAKQ